jgi:hypothetical protein
MATSAVPTLTCLGRDVEGWPCGAEAVIHDITYHYASETPKPDDPPTLVEYVIECPRCGRRMQTVDWRGS